MWQVASNFGRVVERHGAGRRGGVIDLGRAARSPGTSRARAAPSSSPGRGPGLLDALVVNSFAKHVRGFDLTSKSIRNVLGYFRAFLRWPARMERIERVPAFPVIR